MGGLGLIMPVFSHNKDAAWEWIKFCCSGNKQDPAIGKAWVENAGQPARASLLKEYTPIRPYFSGLQAVAAASRCASCRSRSRTRSTRSVGTQVASVVIGEKTPAQALADMQAAATRIMTKGGYYKNLRAPHAIDVPVSESRDAGSRGATRVKGRLAAPRASDRGLLFLAPAVLYLIVMSVYPTIYSLWLAVHNYMIYRPDSVSFAGFDNFTDLLNNEVFSGSFRRHS